MSLAVMVVEDEALLALELEDVLQENGHRVLGPAMSRNQAVRLAEETRPDLALVDVHLLDGPTGVEVARHLSSKGVPVVFMTANVRRIPEDFAGAIGVIEKPYTTNGLQNALTYVVKRLHGEPPPTVPASLTMSPTIA
ncbi:response regulator [Oharaeibacter diazotrophicus]|uniref:Response regulator receiver domain-containing protein n=1 Tax=Oharaeibacter diazotrophicus TaxID=1920512 RepID=A0A4R6RL31_9HYPH|nr:response regulator [Oharaeibacter diazotrophicus]TDP87333.1 response regulator receiver domain-containing protein [Oharaeibacter diazotrophicus]BBE70723.1 putative transcriptional regulatory protein pdtaR [Pleomorphomonas sp. SM30]GLS77471.1 response regulator [Oharaeibacter diazotrophicus]